MPRYIALSVESHHDRCGHDVQRKRILVEQTIMLQNVDPGIDAGSGTRSMNGTITSIIATLCHASQRGMP